jgi:hypothetical protein
MPGLAVVATAIGMGVVVGPTLGEHVAIPPQIYVPAAVPSAVVPSAAGELVGRPHRSPTSAQPTPTVTTASSPTTTTQQPRVVTPQRPLVTASTDDENERDSGSTDHEGTDR